MCIVALMSLEKFLNEKYLDWRREQINKETKRKTQREFAEDLGFERTLFSKWMNGTQPPGEESKVKLFQIFGPEVIEAMGENPVRYAVDTDWNYLSNEAQNTIVNLLEKAKNDRLQQAPKSRKAKSSD